MESNVFIRPIDYYKRNIDPINQYIDQTSFYLSKVKNKDFNEVRNILKSKLNKKSLPQINNPEVLFYERQDNGDNEVAKSTLSDYFKTLNKDNLILAPTFTCYIHPDENRSPLVEFVDGNKKNRSIAKKAAFKAKNDNLIDLYLAKNNEQNNMKLYNNSLSGTFATAGSPLNNPTAHSTLTSTTRLESSISNASNEKLISGNRHYFNPDIILNNLISISYLCDKEEIRKTMSKFNLVYPTKEQVYECITWSSEFYFYDHNSLNKCREFIDLMSDEERAAFVYTSDLFHIRKHNEQFVWDFVTKLSKKICGVVYEDPISIIYSIDEHIVNLAHLICFKESENRGKDYKEKYDAESLNKIAATSKNIETVLNEYLDFIRCFFSTKIMPASTAYIPHMVRRCVVLSDTDSTMFSVDEYINWYFGKIIFTEESRSVAGVIMFMATQSIAHLLAIFSANVNVERAKLFEIAMKPEFFFPVFAQTSVAKHYFTCSMMQEGNARAEPDMEIKGVHLKSSAAPSEMIKAAHSKMKVLLNKVMSNTKISLLQEIKDLADIERKIEKSILMNEAIYFKRSKIKGPHAYALEAEKSPYARHIFWQTVFAPSYNKVEDPPYSVIKIPTTLINKTCLAAWVESIQDIGLKDRLSKWLIENNKKELPTLYVPVDYVKAYGIPKEIMAVIDIKRIILDLTITNKMILQSLGYYCKLDTTLIEQGY